MFQSIKTLIQKGQETQNAKNKNENRIYLKLMQILKKEFSDKNPQKYIEDVMLKNNQLLIQVTNRVFAQEISWRINKLEKILKKKIKVI